MSLQITDQNLTNEKWYKISWTNSVGSELSTVMPETKLASFVELFQIKNTKVRMELVE